MKSFILHVYPRDITPEASPSHHEIVGVVESVEDEKQIPFTSPQELWKILSEHHPENFTTARKKTR